MTLAGMLGVLSDVFLSLWPGAAYAAFYKDPAGANTLIGNYSLVFTPVDANTVKLTFPASFNAATLFTTPGPYRLIETYFPTPNFTQPTPLVIGFTVSVSPSLLAA